MELLQSEQVRFLVTDRLVTQVGENRVMRGGSWLSEAPSVRVAYRRNVAPDYEYHNNGFRCVRKP